MKTNFKDTLVNWSRSKLLTNISWTLAIIGMAIYLFSKSMLIIALTYIGVVTIGIFATCMSAIKQQKEDIIKNNSLINILLSDYDVIFAPIWFIIVVPMFFLFGNRIQSFIMSGIVVLVTLIALHKLSKKVSNYFKEKLNIPE